MRMSEEVTEKTIYVSIQCFKYDFVRNFLSECLIAPNLLGIHTERRCLCMASYRR